MGNREAPLPRRGYPRVALFDLDGTLLDSAPDLLAAANAVLAEHGRAALTLAQLRPVVSKGSRAMLGVAFPDLPAAERDALIPAFLRHYEALIGRHSQPFDGIPELLQRLEEAGSVWGIVTNKPEALARLILPQLQWQQRCAVLIGGDTLPERKPHPLPLQVAAQRLSVAPHEVAYVGDDERDILAARAAGMASVAVLWGYRLDEDDPLAWRADAMVAAPAELYDAAAWPVSAAAS
ncbi:phosphoglycolate phosphatase [Xanthomonas sacchari]|uniref:phosphoglycolate phosphatase n=1 Tax=Xanthomonas sacchari TaxID=56458 RepID=UPI002254CFDF|nr:phosphoglycolate phosphatase [Xanthomonas sacchari]MCW0365991.1 N-acetylmuramic acid 6-phosphate phosphatase [Xanthomonas sacchari]MCW0395174.1 N-acetylmuramic acid 6-phosphate phosphatase [Xanthomonas sacchari]MCW0440055.1 N-acetylmuramic acid 6-phosphate phosphatase [Xanthomonas sacchari]MCW0445035.1 N-acetylmuramic acid 6-phosphate phosphatase [Xanthomonas sacchari]